MDTRGLLPHWQACFVWACALFAYVRLPDARLHQRLIRLVMAMMTRPQGALNRSCENPAAAKAAYRFIANPRVESQDLAMAIVQSTARQCASMVRIAIIQDSSALHMKSAQSAQGLGPIGDTPARGMWLHTSLAMRLDGVSVGVIGLRTWCRDPDAPKPKHHDPRPFWEKESRKWADAIYQAHYAMQDASTILLFIHDAESDIHEVFQIILDLGHGAIIRATYNRRVGEKDSICYSQDLVAQCAPLAACSIAIPRKGDQPARQANVELRAAPMRLRPNPKHHPDRKTLKLNLIEVREIGPPEGVEPIHWFLWTTEPIDTLADVMEVIRLYKLRWRIEDYHLVLKQGCYVQTAQFQTAERWEKFVTLCAPMAAQILRLRDLARVEPDTPCDVVLSPAQWKALWVCIHHRCVPENLPVPTINQAVRWIGRLGGHLGRKGDGMPGVRTLWRGWRALEMPALVYGLVGP